MGILDQIIGAESGGDPTAKNPRSSASGLGQFLDATWLDTIAKHRPDLVQNNTPQGLLAMRSDPALSRAMTEAYAADNGAILSGAGLPVNAGTTYLAHFAGPQGAVKVLQADPGSSVEGILGSKVVAANPFLKGMTAADLTAWAQKKMGGAPQQSAQQIAQASPASPAQAIPQASIPIFPQAVPQQQQATPQQQAPAFDFSQLQPEQMQAPPIFAPPRKPIDLRALRASLARPSAGLFFRS